MENFETSPDSPPITIIDPDDQSMWSSTRNVTPTLISAIVQLPISNNFHVKGTHMQMIQEKQFYRRIWSDPHQHFADFIEISNLFQYGENQEKAVMLRTFPISLSREAKTWLNEGTITSPNPKTIVSAGGNSINDDHAILMDKFKGLTTKIDSKFLKIRKELKEMRDGRKDNHASQIYMSYDTLMCDPMEANYVQGYHGGYYHRDSKIPYSYPSHNYPRYPLRNRMLHPSRYFKLPKISTDEIMREWMAGQTEANECIKNHVVELECQINQGLRNRQAFIENLERQIEFLEKKTQCSESLPHTTNTKSRHEIFYKPPSVRNKNDKGDVKAIKEDETEPIPTLPNPNPINSNSPNVSPFVKDCIVHIPYMTAKMFANAVLPNHMVTKS
nr:reverse transcriptase domain-containing protein [Tanacetum cinerariifolium]